MNFLLHDRNSSVPAVENISCEKLTQDKDFIQNLIDKQVIWIACAGVTANLF